MAEWQRTHGKGRGAYLAIGGSQLYVRQAVGPDGMPSGPWKLFVDGKLEGTADGEAVARAAAELAIRCVADANVAAETAAA